MKRDHEILHYFADNPKAASTNHALVKNDMYGLAHELAYTQTLLTPEQIKDAHDNWVALHDSVGHSTPMGAMTTQAKEHKDRWDTVIINNPDAEKLTKRDIFRYYSSKPVKDKLFKQVKGKPIMMRQVMDVDNNWIKRNPTIVKNINDANDPEDLQYYIERRHVEFHPNFEALTDKLVIDIDPGKNVSLGEVKKVTKYLVKVLENQPDIKDTDIQFSGNRGFYVWGYLNNKQNIDVVRKRIKAILDSFKTMDGVKVTTKQSPGRHTVRLDLSPLKQAGSVKAEGSLDYRTGYVSTNVLKSYIDSFDPKKDATINKTILKPAYSYKDEELV